MTSREEDAILARYERRKSQGKPLLYSLFNPAHAFTMCEVQRWLLYMLNKHGLSDLSDKKILDVGCGNGHWLRNFISYGANPENLHGIDLIPGKVEHCRKLSPAALDVRAGNAERLDFPDGYFDMVTQFVMFTSILDGPFKKRVAGEMLRVARPGGAIIWHDFRYDNPGNPDVKGIDRDEVEALFKGCDFDFKSVVLAPPLTRLVAPYSQILCHALGVIPFLRTHYLAVITKSR